MCGGHLQSASLVLELLVDFTCLSRCGSTHLESIALLGAEAEAGAGAGKLSQVEKQTSLQGEF